MINRHIELDKLDLRDLLLYMVTVMDADVTSADGYSMVLVYR